MVHYSGTVNVRMPGCLAGPACCCPCRFGPQRVHKLWQGNILLEQPRSAICCLELAQLPHMLSARLGLPERLNLVPSEVGLACCLAVLSLHLASPCPVPGIKKTDVTHLFCQHQLPPFALLGCRRCTEMLDMLLAVS